MTGEIDCNNPMLDTEDSCYCSGKLEERTRILAWIRDKSRKMSENGKQLYVLTERQLQGQEEKIEGDKNV